MVFVVVGFRVQGFRAGLGRAERPQQVESQEPNGLRVQGYKP